MGFLARLEHNILLLVLSFKVVLVGSCMKDRVLSRVTPRYLGYRLWCSSLLPKFTMSLLCDCLDENVPHLPCLRWVGVFSCGSISLGCSRHLLEFPPFLSLICFWLLLAVRQYSQTFWNLMWVYLKCKNRTDVGPDLNLEKARY